jgi:hypothetical protein
MATLLDQPLEALLDAPGVTDVSPQVEAFVARVATLALTVGAASATAAVTRALAAGTPEALLGVFADLLAMRSPSAPGAEAALRGRIALAEVIRQSGGLWRADEAPARLGVTRATLQAWRDGQKVLALRLGDASYGYPVAQFAPPASDLAHPRPLAGLAEVLAAVGDRLSAEEVAALLATPQPALAGAGGAPRSGFEALAAGDVALVVGLVEHVVTPADEGAPLADDAGGAAVAALAVAGPPARG